MAVNLTGSESAPSFKNLSSCSGEPSVIQWLLAWTSVQISIHPICCQRLEVMHILIRCCASRQENASILWYCFLFYQAVSALNGEWGSGRKRLLSWPARCRWCTGGRCPPYQVALQGSGSSCEKSGKGKGSTQARGDGGLGTQDLGRQVQL